MVNRSASVCFAQWLKSGGSVLSVVDCAVGPTSATHEDVVVNLGSVACMGEIQSVFDSQSLEESVGSCHKLL